MAAGDADVLVQPRDAVDRRFLRRNDAVGERVDARDRHGQRLRKAQRLRPVVRRVRRRAHRVRDQPVERLDERHRLAPRGVERHRTAERDHRADALRSLVRAVHREHPAEAPAHQAHLAPALVVHVADLLLQGGRVPAGESDVAPEAPGLHLVAAVLEEDPEREERPLVRHEARKQKHRMPVAPRSEREHGHRPRQCGGFEERARLDQLEQQRRAAGVGFACGHGIGGRRSTGAQTGRQPRPVRHPFAGCHNRRPARASPSTEALTGVNPTLRPRAQRPGRRRSVPDLSDSPPPEPSPRPRAVRPGARVAGPN